MRLPHNIIMQHLSVLCPPIWQVCCLLFVCALVCTPADAVQAQEVERPRSAHHLHGVIRLPVYHKSHKSLSHSHQRQPPAHAARHHKHADHGHRTHDQLRSKLLTLGQSEGQYFAKLQIGTPAQDIAVIIDTGSPLLWVQCAPCLRCSPQAQGFPIFNRAHSSSFHSLKCNAPLCKLGDKSLPTGCTHSNACSYNVTYGDKSNSLGILAQERLTFTTSCTGAAEASSSVTLPPLVFGCGNNNTGVESQLNASGLMGLDRGKYSIISQLSIDVFAYCLPDRANSVDVSGYLTLGRARHVRKSSTSSSSNIPPLQYTPMIQNSHSTFLSQFYYVKIIGISINKQILDIPASAFKINAHTGTGGTFVDSGTTFTGFVEEAFDVIIPAFAKAMGTSSSKYLVNLGNNLLCYEAVRSSKHAGPRPPAAPKVTIHLDGAVDMELGADQLFVHLSASATTDSYYCLAITDAGPLASGAGNVIGNFQQQDFLVEYDLVNSRIGIAPTQCSHPSPLF